LGTVANEPAQKKPPRTAMHQAILARNLHRAQSKFLAFETMTWRRRLRRKSGSLVRTYNGCVDRSPPT
jgi:hypothetical protein